MGYLLALPPFVGWRVTRVSFARNLSRMALEKLWPLHSTGSALVAVNVFGTRTLFVPWETGMRVASACSLTLSRPGSIDGAEAVHNKVTGLRPGRRRFPIPLWRVGRDRTSGEAHLLTVADCRRSIRLQHPLKKCGPDHGVREAAWHERHPGRST